MVTLKNNLYNSLNIISIAIKYKLKYTKLIKFRLNLDLVIFLLKKNIILDYTIKENYIYIYFHTSSLFFKNLKFISTPAKRCYVNYNKLISIYGKNAVFGLVLTKYGFLTILECLKYKLGGELICYIY
jgi:ribosomal protein S8